MNAFDAMRPTGESHYILTRSLIENTFFSLFLGDSLHIICSLLCLRYFLNHLLHSVVFLVKTIKTKKGGGTLRSNIGPLTEFDFVFSILSF